MSVKTVDASIPAAVDAAKVSGLLTLGFGVLLLLVVGFVQLPAVHNSAHDTRHANGFPCH